MSADDQAELFEPGLRAAKPKARKRVPRKAAAPQTTQARLSAIVKSARDTMRTDEGLNGDLDRLPQLAWLLFLRCFDAKEDERALLEGATFKPAIAPKYQWKAWGANPSTPTGNALLEFVNNELFPYLANLDQEVKEEDEKRAGFDPRLVISSVFKDLSNRMRNGALLRDVINQVHKVDFTHQEDVHTMALLYEGILREMRDAAGDSGEFYTPRPVIRFMTQQLFPELGEKILDPACGTGGFLVESLGVLMPKAETTKQINALYSDIQGIEKKSLPFLLSMMNMLLHDVPQPHIRRGNSLVIMRNLGRRDKLDVIATNPPFGAEEEASVTNAFDEGFRSRETAWLFLNVIIEKLKDSGRCGIVLPHGILFGNDTIAMNIKEKLLTECNLHTVIRLQQGVFAPYTDIPANLLFFEKGKPTEETWYYELPLPEGRRSYTKSKPLAFEELAECQAWWGGSSRVGRMTTPQAWRVSIEDLRGGGLNLDLSNPHSAADLANHDPAELIAGLIKTEHEILGLLEEIQAELAGGK
ncbi:class I SAM-dependent DNA methyltransferase [Streptomyces sp. H39-S7]|uniref:class I SAM-dependent DNA methyltransferase n=1 Tax=Streptomyces sp. H39-S7 TaxID=3004357 RepID=UPI0022AECBF6|nr:class I SAM-dependent DNA methyltransferase [Streptomyces sp. H39-S7]MCZ4125402.1 class I SAM-dependent DNA methyltransferase [Streptomyces sp. H39-S7]